MAWTFPPIDPRVAMGTHYQPPSQALSTIALSLAIFMQALDSMIANVPLPAIAGNSASAAQSTWVITLFAGCQVISFPFIGFLPPLREIPLFIWCTLLFVLTSLLCGISQSMGMLICSRAAGRCRRPDVPDHPKLADRRHPAEKRRMAFR